MRHIAWDEVFSFCRRLTRGRVHGLGVGGRVLAGVAQNCNSDIELVADVNSADYLIVQEKGDDFRVVGSSLPVVAMIDHDEDTLEDNSSVQFPWEGDELSDPPLSSVEKQLVYIGENVNRPGLRETPARYLKALREMTSGYNEDPVASLGSLFNAGQTSGNGQTVVVRRVEFNSLCEHHMLPFSGHVSLVYAPAQKIVGLSKVPRLIKTHSRRLQIQERLTGMIADDFNRVVKPLGVLVVVTGKHSCMSNRGVECQNGSMVTMAHRGIFDQNCTKRHEALRLMEMQ